MESDWSDYWHVKTNIGVILDLTFISYNEAERDIWLTGETCGNSAMVIFLMINKGVITIFYSYTSLLITRTR